MSGGKRISQQELRKAMMIQKKKSGTVKVDSPLAKYTESGQLMCILCKSIIRHETVWVVHLNSKSHKENVAAAKKGLDSKETSANVPRGKNTFKRPISPVREEPSKKLKGILKNNETSSALPSDFFDDANGISKTTAETVAAVTRKTDQMEINPSTTVGSRGTEGENPEAKEAESNNPAALPEGFFDDPILDAKVRNVEYKDPIEEEWEKFQREMRDEAAQSAQIIAEDQEEATNERQLDEIEEQMRCHLRVMDLAIRQEQLKLAHKERDSGDENMSSGDDSDYDEFLDWRAKTSYK